MFSDDTAEFFDAKISKPMAIAIIRLLEIVNVEDKKGIPSARCPGKYCFDQAFRFPLL